MFLGFEIENIWIVYLDFYDVEDILVALVIKVRLREELLALLQIEVVFYGGDVSFFSGLIWLINNDNNGFMI